MPEIAGWQDHERDLHDWNADPPEDISEIAAVRAYGIDPETDEQQWFTFLGPFDVDDLDAFDDYIDELVAEIYGEFV